MLILYGYTVLPVQNSWPLITSTLLVSDIDQMQTIWSHKHTQCQGTLVHKHVTHARAGLITIKLSSIAKVFQFLITNEEIYSYFIASAGLYISSSQIKKWWRLSLNVDEVTNKTGEISTVAIYE